MKPFVVNRDSWHYKLNVRMCKTNDRLSRDDNAVKYVMSKDNLCTYWQMTAWSLIKVLITAFFALSLVYIVGYLIYLYGYAWLFHTFDTFVATTSVIATIAGIVGLVTLFAWLDKRKKRKLDDILYHGETETSLSKAKYSSWKYGICLPVEFK
jgi:hypothetical protein